MRTIHTPPNHTHTQIFSQCDPRLLTSSPNHDIIQFEHLFHWSHHGGTERLIFIFFWWEGGHCFGGWRGDSAAMPLNTSYHNKRPLSAAALALRSTSASSSSSCWPASKPWNSPVTVCLWHLAPPLLHSRLSFQRQKTPPKKPKKKSQARKPEKRGVFSSWSDYDGFCRGPGDLSSATQIWMAMANI